MGNYREVAGIEPHLLLRIQKVRNGGACREDRRSQVKPPREPDDLLTSRMKQHDRDREQKQYDARLEERRGSANRCCAEEYHHNE